MIMYHKGLCTASEIFIFPSKIKLFVHFLRIFSPVFSSLSVRVEENYRICNSFATFSPPGIICISSFVSIRNATVITR